jgi:hypothetical protein
MRTAGFRPPLMLTNPTPGTWEILGSSRVSAKSSTFVSGMVFDVSAKARIGASAGFILLYTGGAGRSVGERWRSNCGCNSGGHHWNQEWRAPLRAVLDWLRDRLAPVFEKSLSNFVRDPGATRDDYIRVILDRSEGSRAAFLADHAIRPLSEQEQNWVTNTIPGNYALNLRRL